MNTHKIILSIAILLLFVGDAISQLEPPVIQYNIEPNWTYLSIDSNAVPSVTNPNTNIYNSRNPVLSNLYNGNLVIAENTLKAGFNGFLVHSLDQSTGEQNWIHHDNSYVGNTHPESLLGGLMSLTPQGIEIINSVGMDTFDAIFPTFDYFGNYKTRLFDYDTGSIINQAEGQDTTKTVYTVLGNGWARLLRDGNDKLQQFMVTSIDDAGEVVLLLNRRFLNNDLIVDSTSIDTIEYRYGDLTKPQSAGHFTYPHYYKQLNDSIIVMLSGDYDNVDFFQSPKSAALTYYNISDTSEIRTKTRIDITEDFGRPNDHDHTPSLATLDNTAIISQKVTPLGSQDTINKTYFWLSWYDNDGSQIAHIDCLQGNYASEVRQVPIMVLDDELIFAATYRDESIGEMGYVFYAIPKNSYNEYRQIGTFSMPYTDQYDVSQILLPTLLPDNNIMVGTPIVQNTNNGFSNFFFYHSLSLTDLGITSNTQDIPIQEIDISVSPNPSGGLIKISGIDLSRGTVGIIDLQGNRVHQSTLSGSESFINLSHLVSGQYFVQYHRASDNVFKVIPITLQ